MVEGGGRWLREVVVQDGVLEGEIKGERWQERVKERVRVRVGIGWLKPMGNP